MAWRIRVGSLNRFSCRLMSASTPRILSQADALSTSSAKACLATFCTCKVKAATSVTKPHDHNVPSLHCQTTLPSQYWGGKDDPEDDGECHQLAMGCYSSWMTKDDRHRKKKSLSSTQQPTSETVSMTSCVDT